MRTAQLPAAVGTALSKTLGLAVTTLLLIVGLAGTAMARPLPGDGAGSGTIPSTPGSDAGSSSLLLLVAVAVTVIVLSGLAALVVAARRRTHHQGASTT
jgi:hypothetical protein